MLIVGNWKMNLLPHEGMMLTHEICTGMSSLPSHVRMVICPPFTHLAQCSVIIESDGASLSLGAQNCHFAESGAFTGEVSAQMLASMGVEYVILGHSERRTLFNETDDLIALKCLSTLKAGLNPVLCVGETLEERNTGKVNDIISHQLFSILDRSEIMDLIQDGEIVIAYEPVWAIGTGMAAGPEQAEEIHMLIRSILDERLKEQSSMIDIIYGGSVKPENAKQFFAMPNIDGALIGGASLNADTFLNIASLA
jgi:triosephosphate isomerase